MNNLLKYLNNQIVIWENRYGDYYTMLYDEKGNLIQTNEIMQNDYLKWLYASQQTLSVLRKIKRNRFKNIKRFEKKRYKINYKSEVENAR